MPVIGRRPSRVGTYRAEHLRVTEKGTAAIGSELAMPQCTANMNQVMKIAAPMSMAKA